jgi:hypothetical protein
MHNTNGKIFSIYAVHYTVQNVYMNIQCTIRMVSIYRFSQGMVLLFRYVYVYLFSSKSAPASSRSSIYAGGP